MFIISGKYRRRRIQYPKNSPYCRPTKSMVREAVFNRLQHDIDGAYVLDLCAGTGAVGLEALSRGAAHVTFVDTHTKYIKENCSGLKDDIVIVKKDAFEFIKSYKKKPFNIIYFDPNWDNNILYLNTLKHVFDFDILESNGVFICEHQKSYQLPEFPHIQIQSEHVYGDSKVSVIRCQ